MKDKHVEETVLEIKDKSELMVDLAYSSLLYDNKTIAKEVYDLEDLIDDLYQHIQKKTLENVQNKNLSIDNALTILQLAECGEQISDAAQDIADVELRDVELHPILMESIRESDEVFTRVMVQPESVFCGKTLGELKIKSETGMYVIAMRHHDRWLYGPNKSTLIDPEDVLFAKGPRDAEEHLKSLAKGKEKEL